MRRPNYPVIAVAVLFVLFVIVLCLPVTHDAFAWQRARMSDTIESYARYLKNRPGGRHATAALARQDDLAWEAAKAKPGLTAYSQYAQTYTNGQHLAEAQAEIEQITWQLAVTANTMAGFEDFIARFPNSKSAPSARARIEEGKWQQANSTRSLRLVRAYLTTYPQGRHIAEARKLETAVNADETPLRNALTAQSEKALRNFLTEYPGHSQEAEARQALKDLTQGRDIFDLIADKKIEAYGLGAGSKQLQVKLRKITPGAVTVRIPVGTYCESDIARVQGMVVIEERKVRLEAEFWTETEIPVASTSFSKTEPDFNHAFQFRRLPTNSPVAGVFPLLQKSGATFPVWQAAFWLITDNVNYDQLGVLTFHPNGFLLDNERFIKEADTVRALQLVEQSGVDITQRKIWKKSRAEILKGLKDPELRAWVEARPAAEK